MGMAASRSTALNGEKTQAFQDNLHLLLLPASSIVVPDALATLARGSTDSLLVGVELLLCCVFVLLHAIQAHDANT
jgi:hypothetical protein